MTRDEALKVLQSVYGDEPWLETMAALGPEQTKGFARLAQGLLLEGPLPLKIKHIMLFIIYVAKGYEPMARLHLAAGNRAGATMDEWHEALMVFVPSRGEMMYMEGARIVGLKAKPQGADTDTVFQKKDELLAYFKRAMGTVPAFVQILADQKPTMFEGYFKLRSENLKDGKIPQKYKELMLVALNTAERYEEGVAIHAKAALGAGASKEELLDGMTVAIMAGGVPGWIESSKVYAKLTA